MIFRPSPMKITLFRYLSALISGLFCAACMHAATQVNTLPVFTARTTAADVPAELQGRGVRRVRAVEIDLAAIQAAPNVVHLNFFPDVNLDVGWTKSERVELPAGTVWTGTVVGSPLGQATLVISGKTVTGNITRGDGLMYQIRTSGDGRWWVREIDQKEFPAESVPLTPGRQ
jgi:hypothetical protein